MEIVPEDFTPFWVENLTSEKYHADKTAVSSSALRKILKSPKTFRAHFLEPQERKETTSFRIGSALHLALLEPDVFERTFVVPPTFKGKGSVAAYDEWEADIKSHTPDALILTAKEKQQIDGMIDSVLSHNLACTLMKNGTAEMSGYYRDPETGIKCRVRPDFLNTSVNALIDVKTCENCEEEAFFKHALFYGYDFQLAMYWDAIALINGKPLSHGIFLAIEKGPPYEVALHEDEMKDDMGFKTHPFMDLGRAKYRHAMSTLKTCIDNQKWPGYREDVINKIKVPAWANKGVIQ